jgi:RHS repeat-associated protein
MSGPRPQLVQGYTNEPSKVTINGTRADNADHNQFTRNIDAEPGANTVTASATDMSANTNTTTQSWDIDVPETQPFAYDANGNLLSDGTRTYTWDAVNRLISVSMGVDTWTFGYDGLDRRVTESKNGTLMKKWLWCGTSICEERAPNDTVTKRYFTHGEERVGDWDAGEYFYTTDHLGSIRDVTTTVGGSAVSVARYDYDPYGHRQKLVGTTTYTCDFGFTGHHTHAATGLVLTLYRAYDPALGRWLSADPIEENGGLNLYGYAGGNPIMLVDPLGLLFGMGISVGELWQATKESFSDGSAKQSAIGGAAAFADGAIPFADPFADNGVYDDCDSNFGFSKGVGEFTRNMWASYGIAKGVSLLGGGATLSIGATRGSGAGFHAFYGVTRGGTTTWMHGAFASHTGTQIATQVSPGLAGFSTYFNTLTGIPIAFPAAAAATGVPTKNCVTGALGALRRGLIGR